MNKLRSRAAVSIAVLAALSMTATPALARGYDDWGRHRHHHHGDRIDGGDLLAGLLIVGGIAAIAHAASKSSKERDGREREPDRYPGGPDYGEPDNRDYGAVPEDRPEYPGGARPSSGFDEAVDSCAEALDRGEHRLDTVDNVGRTGDGFEVEGRLEDGRGYTCGVDEGGAVRSVEVEGHAVV